ncbi:MAG: DNA helicase RecQ [Planctomycetaceae bacterium]
MENSLAAGARRQLVDVLQRYWGHDRFRPLQEAAMASGLASEDSLVVLPTGGGKSLCFQAPAMCLTGMAVVVSPLISLMKDQVDGLNQVGIPAACINHSLSREERLTVADQVRQGITKILYVAPERLLMERTLSFLKSVSVSLIAVDEAHCISEWGHDFRPEYRELSRLKEHFPGVAIHAYTATATQRVRVDITRQLGLSEPNVMVGSFHRPNLVYRVHRRSDTLQQVQSVLQRRIGESGIIYCISRNEVDRLSRRLTDAGYRALPYHAGLDDLVRRKNQDDFIQDRAQLIVATVAFGMGIDKPDVRFVIHAGMPKSLENYQQESGRAGRDGLESECLLLYSGGDYGRWQAMCQDQSGAGRDAAGQSLSAMYGFCTATTCRHQSLLAYFGQGFDAACQSCDVCLGELTALGDGLIVAQKILSCVVRLKEGYGADYTAKVLAGSRVQRILDQRHDQLTTYGLLSNEQHGNIRDWIEQLVAQHYLSKSDEHSVLQMTDAGWRLMRDGQGALLLSERRKTSRRRTSVRQEPAAGDEQADATLLRLLKDLRLNLARAQGVPPYLVFNDAALNDMARRKPVSSIEFLEVHGVGLKKCKTYGDTYVECMKA